MKLYDFLVVCFETRTSRLKYKLSTKKHHGKHGTLCD